MCVLFHCRIKTTNPQPKVKWQFDRDASACHFGSSFVCCCIRQPRGWGLLALSLAVVDCYSMLNPASAGTHWPPLWTWGGGDFSVTAQPEAAANNLLSFSGWSCVKGAVGRNDRFLWKLLPVGCMSQAIPRIISSWRPCGITGAVLWEVLSNPRACGSKSSTPWAVRQLAWLDGRSLS